MKLHSTSKHKKTKWLAIVILVALLGASSFLLYRTLQDRDSAPESESVIDSGGGTTNLAPATDEDKERVERHKQQLSENSENPQQDEGDTPDTTEPKQAVTPIIGYIQQASNGDVEANGYVPGIVETEGTCKLILQKAGTTTSEAKRAIPDAQSTVCGRIAISRSQLDAGEWRAVIQYSSPRHEGNSEAMVISIK